MKIDRCDLNAFGKFENKSILFKEGINLVYGKNEKGKSTIASFIIAMFYGFFKPHLKKRQYESDYKKYRPWATKQYRGSLSLETNRGRFLIERDFLLKDDYVKVYDLNENKDISNELSIDYANEVGKWLFGINKIVFRNSIHIAQNSVKTSNNLSDEIKDLLCHFQYGTSRSIRVNNIIKELEHEKSEIGTKKAKTKPLGRAYERLEELVKERHLARENLEAIRKVKAKEKILFDQAKEVSSRIRSNKEEVDSNKKESKEKIESEISFLEDKIKESEFLEKVSFEDAYNIFDLASEKKKLKIDLEEDRLFFEEQKRRNRKKKSDVSVEEIDITFNNYFDTVKSINELKYKENLKTRNYIYIYLGYLLGFISMLLTLFVDKLFSIAALAFLIISILTHLKKNKELKNIFIQEKKREVLEEKIMKWCDEASTERSVTSVALKEIKEYFREDNLDHSYLHARMSQMKDKKKKYDDIRIELKRLLDVNGVSDVSLYRDRLKEKEVYLEMKAKLENLKIKRDTISMSCDEEIEKSSFLVSKLSEIQSKLATYKERVRQLDNRYRYFLEIEADILALKNEIASYKERIEVINVTITALDMAISKIQKEYQPKLNMLCNKRIGELTSGKYTKVMIDADFNIKIYDDESSKFVDIERLSVGTIDLLYFSLRLNILDLIFEKSKFPYIVDDIFVNFDDERLENVLLYLAKIASEEKRQIILFTCQKREKNILKELNIEFNEIRI